MNIVFLHPLVLMDMLRAERVVFAEDHTYAQQQHRCCHEHDSQHNGAHESEGRLKSVELVLHIILFFKAFQFVSKTFAPAKVQQKNDICKYKKPIKKYIYT